MQFFTSAIDTLQTLVVALGAGLGVWGVVNLLEGYGSDNPGSKSQGMKQLMGIIIFVLVYGRMIEIYLMTSLAPLPVATLSNRELGGTGQNYLKSLFALGFQGFLIMICVGIYAVLVNTLTVADNLHSAIFSIAAYTVILCFSLFKTGALAKSIFHAH